jgi:putative ABC transport system permease protein
MIKNYFKIAFRNLVRNKVFSFINISGLAIGLATCLIIMLFIQNELSFDRYNKKAGQVVRVIFRGTVQGQKMNEPNVMPPTAQTLKETFPEVLEATRLRDFGMPRVKYGEKTYRDNTFAFADSNFFSVFTIPFIQGDPKTALIEPNTVVITKAVATKYFGSENPIGKMLTFIDGNTVCKVTGVIDKVPDNSHFHFDLFVSMSSTPEARSTSWMESGYYTYLVLPVGYDYKKLEAKLPPVVLKNMAPQFIESFGMSMETYLKKGNDLGLYLQPLTDIHLHSNFAFDLGQAGDIRYVYIFGAIAIFMLIIACINFMNLSTAGASKRSREVGIRKVLGSLKQELVRQFLVESIMLTAIALVLAIGLVYLALPVFNKLADKNLTLQFTATPWVIPSLVLFGLFTGVLAGSYPAFYLSSFNPVAVLKGRFTSGKKNISFRSALVVFQFFISICLIICTTVVFNQLNYIRHVKLGYDKDQVVVIPDTWILDKKEGVFREQLLQDPRVVSVSASGYLPAGPTNNNNYFLRADDNVSQIQKTLRYDVDYAYIPSMGMEMASGRNFSKDYPTDSMALIINETAAKAFGWGNNAVGHNLLDPDNHGNKRKSYRVIGVVKDFHFKSLHELISPLVMKMGNNGGTLIVKTTTRDLPGLLSSMDKRWTALTPDAPFSYSFLDDRFKRTYHSEQTTGLILGIFAGLTIFVACLGLFGLATFTAEQRTKEIGIRKILGATVTGILSLLSRDFLKLVFIAFIIAAPVAWYAMNKWLLDFAYHDAINVWIFILAASAASFITIATISFQAIKAALANPVKSLRSE